MAEFTCAVATVGAAKVVKASGDLDLAVAEGLWRLLEPLLTPGATVALDCSGITFLDSTGLRAAVLAANHAKETDAVFCLIAPSEPVARVLDLSGLTGMFTVYADPAEAAAAGPTTRT